MKYLVVFEQTPNNWSAYVPDLPGCVAAGATRAETRRLIAEAMALHIEALQEHHERVPLPGEWIEEIELLTPTVQT